MKKIAFVLFILVAFTAKSDPIVGGAWFGYTIANDLKMPTNLYITEDNTGGKITGDITIAYNYKSGKTYYCKARFSGNVDYKTYEFRLVMEEYVYYDVLPEGMKWCLGMIYGNISREMELKEYIIVATLKNNCAEETSMLVMIKQQ